MNIKNSLGLSFDILKNGLVEQITVDPIRISLKAVSPYSKWGMNIYLRRKSDTIQFKALLGPESNSLYIIENDLFIAYGNWEGLEYKCVLQLSKTSLSWQWSINIKNQTDDIVEIDLIYVQDVGLKSITTGLINEYYVSQYIERRILMDKNYGSVLCCRQNMKESVGNPWLMLACKNGATAASTDGMQFYGNTFRETGIPEGLLINHLGGEYSGESSIVALQEKAYYISAGQNYNSIFVATYLPNHSEATSYNDLKQLPYLMSEFEDVIISQYKHWSFLPEINLFNTSKFLPVNDLNDKELEIFFGNDRRFSEEENGQLLSFFCKEHCHVVLRAKEIKVDRPHAHIMQAKADYIPDENIVSTTSFAYGVFNSHLTQGNTNFNILLSVCSNPFNLEHETGQRILVEIDNQIYLLGIPSAFEMGLNHCRWIYKHGDYCFQVRTWTSKKFPQVNMDFKVICGKNVRLLITHHFDVANGWKIYPGDASDEYIVKPGVESMIAGKFPNAQFRIIIQSINACYKACGDEVIYRDNRNHGNSIFVLDVRDTSYFCMSLAGEVCSRTKLVTIENPDSQWLSDTQDAQVAWHDLCLNLRLKHNQEDIAAIHEILPWYCMNAITHYLTPYGLEQFSGAAWGTRDVTQGPFDLLLCMGKYEAAKKVLRIVFSNQNPDGGWPQWWMFDSYSNVRADSSHGDVMYWCIIALCNYIKVTSDIAFLYEILPYYHEKDVHNTEKTTLSEHIDRLIAKVIDSFIPGTALVPFGGGDWNDSLQPVNKELAQRLISSWTVEMNFHAFSQYQHVCELIGETSKAKALQEICSKIKADFNKYLVRKGVIAGYGLIEEEGNISLLFHPDDNKTNIHYSILPMNRGIISEIFTEEQAVYHQNLIEKYLKGPDGARLMDRPLKYRGGIQMLFQRAESSTFFGREIGLMYFHEHIRYAESLARTGRAEAFLKALHQVIPIHYRDIVPCGDIRQSNCYYSSSDTIFKNRYEADEHYNEVISGKKALKGGWRVYSSGPGIYINLIVTRLLGIRLEFGNIIIDPVMPYSLDGLSAFINLMGYQINFIYAVKENNFSPNAIYINGKSVKFITENYKYRKGGVVIPFDQFRSMLNQVYNIVEIKI